MQEVKQQQLKIKIDLPVGTNKTSKFSADDYLSDLEKQGSQIYISKEKIPWIRTENISMTRFPNFNFEIPSQSELDEIVSLKNIFLASYVIEPKENFPANSVIYICSKNQYSPTKLSSSLQRNIRRAKKDLTIRQVNYDEFMTNGIQAYCDTRNRVGLNDGTEFHFQNKFSRFNEFKTYKIWGAFFDGKLIAYALVNEMECWAELSIYSLTNYLKQHPNDYLVFFILNHYLVERQFEFLNYGLSSIQLNSNKDGLHQFKVKFLFYPIPVHRIFYIRKNFKFLKNNFIKKSLRLVVKLNPQNRWLKKLEGVLELLN